MSSAFGRWSCDLSSATIPLPFKRIVHCLHHSSGQIPLRYCFQFLGPLGGAPTISLGESGAIVDTHLKLPRLLASAVNLCEMFLLRSCFSISALIWLGQLDP